MNNFGLAFIIFLVWTLVSLWVYSWSTTDHAMTNDTTTTYSPVIATEKITTPVVDTIGKISTTKNPKPIAAKAGLIAKSISHDTIFSFVEGFTFKKNVDKLYTPSSTNDYKYQLVDHLNAHPDQELHILSTYSPVEKIVTPNLGIQRGDIILKELINIGADENRLVVTSIIDDIDFNEDNSFTNGISFQFKALNRERIEKMKLMAAEIPDRITFYPLYSDKGILADEKIETALASVKKILDNNPNVNLEIIGHTDNVSNANYNYAVALTSAEEVLWYFKSKGNIDANRMRAISKGEATPIRSNKTEAGRKANKRIELQFIK